MVIGPPDRLISTLAPASASSEAGVTGIHMSSQISMPIVRPGTSSAANSRSIPNGARSAPTAIVSPAMPRAGGEMAALVEFAIGRQIRLGARRRECGRDGSRRRNCRCARHGAAARRRSARVINSDDASTIAASPRSTASSSGSCFDQVLDRITAQAELGKHGDRDRLLVAGARGRQDRLSIRSRIGDVRGGDAGRHARKSMAVDRVEIHRARDLCLPKQPRCQPVCLL